mmetsp:Transcript_5218/g.18283  ORF Transcript_5218/g.18283 Transcript_5218/m.18283 type:complete len:451 (+) Transcript_5218:1677-3029(+)
MRSHVALVLHQPRQQGDDLDSLSQAHLIGQDPVEPVLVQAQHPLQARDLVAPQAGLAQQVGQRRLALHGVRRVVELVPGPLLVVLLLSHPLRHHEVALIQGRLKLHQLNLVPEALEVVLRVIQELGELLELVLIRGGYPAHALPDQRGVGLRVLLLQRAEHPLPAVLLLHLVVVPAQLLVELHQALAARPEFVLVGGHHVQVRLPAPPQIHVPQSLEFLSIGLRLLGERDFLACELPRELVELLGLHHLHLKLLAQDLLPQLLLKLSQLQRLGLDRVRDDLRGSDACPPLPGDDSVQLCDCALHRPVPAALGLLPDDRRHRCSGLPGQVRPDGVANPREELNQAGLRLDLGSQRHQPALDQLVVHLGGEGPTSGADSGGAGRIEDRLLLLRRPAQLWRRLGRRRPRGGIPVRSCGRHGRRPPRLLRARRRPPGLLIRLGPLGPRELPQRV